MRMVPQVRVWVYTCRGAGLGSSGRCARVRCGADRPNPAHTPHASLTHRTEAPMLPRTKLLALAALVVRAAADGREQLPVMLGERADLDPTR